MSFSPIPVLHIAQTQTTEIYRDSAPAPELQPGGVGYLGKNFEIYIVWKYFNMVSGKRKLVHFSSDIY